MSNPAALWRQEGNLDGEFVTGRKKNIQLNHFRLGGVTLSYMPIGNFVFGHGAEPLHATNGD